jgi:hypothetical protein
VYWFGACHDKRRLEMETAFHTDRICGPHFRTIESPMDAQLRPPFNLERLLAHRCVRPVFRHSPNELAISNYDVAIYRPVSVSTVARRDGIFTVKYANGITALRLPTDLFVDARLHSNQLLGRVGDENEDFLFHSQGFSSLTQRGHSAGLRHHDLATFTMEPSFGLCK